MAKTAALLVALALAGAAAAPAPAAAKPSAAPRVVPVPPHVAVALAHDGAVAMAAYTHGASTAVVAEYVNVTIGRAATRKRGYYVEGDDPYEMGYVYGFATANETALMCTTYIDHIVISLLDEALDELLQNSTFAPIYDALLVLLTDLLVNDSMASFNASVAAGAIPRGLVDEMRGIADGARAANASTPVAYSLVATLNFGYDFLMAMIYTGNIFSLLGARAAEWAASGRLQAVIDGSATMTAAGATPAAALAALRALPRSALRPPVACDAFAASGAATAGGGTIFARDFQFPVALVWQALQSTTVWMPATAAARFQALTCVGSPAFVGCMTAHNAAGVALGVDVLQAAVANTTIVGLNSLLMVRAVAQDPATTTAEAAVAYIAAAARGVPWLYPIADAGGDARVIEGGPADPNCTSAARNACAPPDFRGVVAAENATVAALLPPPAALAAALGGALDYRRGIFVRHAGAPLPLAASGLLGAYNPALFAAAGVPYPAGGGANGSGAWGPGGAVWRGFAEETRYFGAIGRKYFSPDRFDDLPPTMRVIAVSNLAVVPHLRIAGMTFWTSITEMGSPQWRFDALAAAVRAAALAGNITFASAKELITFLAPSRTPGFYSEPDVPGIVSVVDLDAGVLAALGGYWGDSWSHVTLALYTPTPPGSATLRGAAVAR